MQDGQIFPLKQYHFEHLLVDPKAAKKLIPFQTPRVQLDVSPLSFKFFDRWCDFMFRFGQMSRQVQNFK